jgi:uncharacterized protein (UPF0276 family)
MNHKIHKLAALAGLSAGLIGSAALSSPAFAMTELAQGYALGAATAQGTSTPTAQQDRTDSAAEPPSSKHDGHANHADKPAADTATHTHDGKSKDKKNKKKKKKDKTKDNRWAKASVAKANAVAQPELARNWRQPPRLSAGLGLRRSLIAELLEAPADALDFLECAPENWIGVGGELGERLAELSRRHPLSCHGLSLSLGGTEPLDRELLGRTRQFLDFHRVAMYSEHLSWCSAAGHLYELLPLPFTEEAVRHVSARICQAQDLLGRRIAIENISYYAHLPSAAGEALLSESQFVCAVLAEADCQLLLDVNNVLVNAVNHDDDACHYIAAMPTTRIASYHLAGHYDEEPGLKIDTHGCAVADEVWSLLQYAYACHGVRPTLLERDFNFPPLATLLSEVAGIRRLQAQAELSAETLYA